MTALAILYAHDVFLIFFYVSIAFVVSINSFDTSTEAVVFPASEGKLRNFPSNLNLQEEDDGDIQKLRDYCCNKNDHDSFCTEQKCYFVIKEKSSWLTSRTSCSREYVRQERLADAATFQDITEFEKVKTSLLSDEDMFWIGGRSCPGPSRVRLEYDKKWLNDKPILEWLDANRSGDLRNDVCMFLTTENRGSVFRFEEETKKYMTLCELKVPERSTADTTTTEISVTKTQPSTTTLLSTTSPIDESKGWCKGRLYEDISWPRTPGGQQAKINCPEGTIGTATWECDAETNEFISEPNMMNCVSEWLKNIEDDVIVFGKDALDIAHNLAKQTKEKELKFGDLPGVIRAIRSLSEHFKGSDQGRKRRFGKAAVETGSSLLGKRKKISWEKLDMELRIQSATKLIQQIENVGKMISCKNEPSSTEEDVSSENIILQSYTFKSEEPCIFPRTSNVSNMTSYIRLPSVLDLPRALLCSSHVTGYGILYDGISSHLPFKKKSNRRINSKIISFTYGGGGQTIRFPTNDEMLISLKHTEELEGKSHCVFWNFTSLQWDDSGCWKVGGNQTHTECKCSHLTNFAVLMDLSGDIRSSTDPVIKYLSIVCCGVSSFALIFTISCLIGFRSSHSKRNTITCNLAFCLLAVNLLILFGVKRTEIETLCLVISGALHYFALASFCWMLLEAYHLYQMVIVVFERINAIKLRWFCISAYGVPLLIVLPSLLLSPKSYSDANVCWLSAKDNMIWVFAGPVAFILMINTIILVMALQSARNVKMKKQQSKTRNLIGWIKGSFSLMSLLGISWILGFINIYKGIPPLLYIFIILNGLQGCFIMIFHVIINEKVRGCIIAFVTRAQVSGKGFRSSMQTTTSSRHPLHSRGRSESSKESQVYFSSPRRISVSPASNTTTYTGHM